MKRPALDELMAGASVVFYASALYDPARTPRAQAVKCVGCGRLVAITPGVYADRCVQASLAGRRLQVCCLDCLAEMQEDAALLLAMPSSDEMAEGEGCL